MGYTENNLGVTPDFSKIVVSFWFSAPSSSIANAAAALGTFFAGRLPLAVFGAKKNIMDHSSSTQDVLDWKSDGTAPHGIEQTIWEEGATEGEELPPCWIALDCSGDDPKLSINIQTETAPSVTGYRYYIPSIEGWSSFDPEAPETDVTPGNGAFNIDFGPIECAAPVDASYVDSATPAAFTIRNQTAITPDVPHHVLLSFDLTGGGATTQVSYPNDAPEDTDTQTGSCSKCYLAIDDVNQTGQTGLGDSWVDGGGPNDILPYSQYFADAFLVANQANTSLLFDWEVGPATYTLTSPVVGAGTVGIPVNSDYNTENFRVRIGELQIYTGVSIDTGIESNRRAFITSDRRPVSPTLAIALLGKEPDVRPQTVGDWQTGNNRGTTGNFTPTGTIIGFEFDYD